MKKIFMLVVLLILCSTVLFSQDTNEKKKGIIPPYIGLYTRTEVSHFGLQSYKRGEHGRGTQLLQWFMLDFMFGQRIYGHGQLGINLPITDGENEYLKLTFGGGFGAYILDRRVNGIGNSWNLNLDFISMTDWLLNELSIGAEISTFYNYHMGNNLAFRAGLNFGVYFMNSIAVNYGLSIGLAF